LNSNLNKKIFKLIHFLTDFIPLQLSHTKINVVLSEINSTKISSSLFYDPNIQQFLLSHYIFSLMDFLLSSSSFSPCLSHTIDVFQGSRKKIKVAYLPWIACVCISPLLIREWWRNVYSLLSANKCHVWKIERRINLLLFLLLLRVFSM
jgi:hypothetical protein